MSLLDSGLWSLALLVLLCTPVVKAPRPRAFRPKFGCKMEEGGQVMLFARKKETTATKLARAAGRVAGKAVRTGGKAAAAASVAGRATGRTAGKVADAVSRTRKAVRRAAARRKVRKTLAEAGRSLKAVGKTAAVAGLAVAAAATVSEIVKRRRNS
jgi:hypothetical protein